ncbi:ATP-dependent helicase/nuclease subunit A [Fusarium austroafricanum]|uniref:ATP-dependent helicase/nuclease subunit A n=1 Tax=Fusarium austroafricanum TaxID=2364996 RepID=A0A8H4KC30_9HYPO|nr:ATP-dependent helicase/nuclease subunit A [Fusarium austroafricanum]
MAEQGLPVELLDHIISYLPNRDIKNLRLTSVGFGNAVRLRLKRVFLSANPLNIQVLEEIAESDKYRKDIVELIWDDTYLMEVKTITRPRIEDVPPKKHCHIDLDRRCPKWYLRKSEECIEALIKSNGKGVDRLATAMSPEASYAYYYNLAEQQRHILESNADVDAFLYALKRFPSLSRVTISPKAHGRLFMPMYETPMIRAFPPGFVYPLPPPGGLSQKADFLWRDEARPRSRYTTMWRGFCSALHILAKHGNHNIVEFVVEECRNCWGMQPDLFNSTGHTYADLVSLLRAPGFRGLHLPFIEGGCWKERTLESLQRFYGVVKDTKSLKNYSVSNLCFDYPWEDESWPREALSYTDDPMDSHFSLLAKSPPKKLEHLTLQGLRVNKDKLVVVLSSLPSLRTLELRFMNFTAHRNINGHKCSYRSFSPAEFLSDIREKLDWRGRSVARRPKVTVFFRGRSSAEGQIVKVDSAINDFLYGHGENPFYVPEIVEFDCDESVPFPEYWMRVEKGTIPELCCGNGIEVDEFDPSHERPLQQLGFTREEDKAYIRDKDALWGFVPRLT